MTQDSSPDPGSAFLIDQGPEGAVPRRLPDGQLARLWQAEVPKVVQRHEAERLQVRRALGLIG